ncbi:selenocysteine-specific translation elongation factor [Thiohalophilus sp.]|uniref:selenocysteine-specific translation elongation factor n=1 Tax=Thiohalophilus sp. TaxID=3028392 RepID=UPI002ACD3180|nr:selenocysteine-specific translation elongation factor [Thiohalophilus sp.]MDZ7802745.1 selenocysteine-specific translation elongation factor [Thiohalophilus sp.]
MLIGTAGHIDHGKTALVKALTGVDADRLPQEQARGITLDLGYAYTPLSDGSVLGFVDVPGHEKLIRNMLAGATAIDFVLLVIAADDGPMPQTREHLELLELLGRTRGTVALTKIDVVSAERLEAVRQEVKQLLADTGLSGSPIFSVSGRTGEGIEPLRIHLETMATLFHPRSATGRFRLAIDRCFSLTGVGTVVTGTAHAGAVNVGEMLTLSPLGVKARVRELHVQDRSAERGQAGERCALALKGDFDKQDIARGMWLVDPALALPLSRFQGEVRIPAGQKPVTHMQNVHVHLGSDDIVGRVALLDCKEINAGDTALVEILLERETLALHGDRFILRDAGAQRTVAGGRVLDIFPPTRHKRTPQRLALLNKLRDVDPAVALECLADQVEAGIDLNRFAMSWNLSEADAEMLWQRVGLRVIREGETTTGITPAAWTALRSKLLEALTAEHERAPDMIGVEVERLRRMTSSRLSRPVFQALSEELLANGAIVQTRSWLHLPEHRATVTADDRELFAELKPLLDASPYNPPRVRDVFRATGTPEHVVRQLFKRLARTGELYPVAHDHYFTARAVEELAEHVRQLNEQQGAARAAPFRDIIFPDGSGGRKVAIRILEFFDRIGYTRRVRDDHVLRHDSALQHWSAQ